ncbi:MAG: transcriptional regulator, GntR family [Bacillota bacterium]|jgi:GntR family transcriptional regulator|nr:transcriptional regulator, GntR family [Bacillota bacterium]
MDDLIKLREEEPLYIRLQDIIMKKIEAGEYLPGEKLPSERVLAEKYAINRMTVKSAVNALEAKGYLYRLQGKGTFVQKKDFHKLNLGLLNESGNTGITARVKSQGVRISNKILTQGLLSGSRFFSSKLDVSINDPIYSLHRVRYGNEEPIAIEYTYVPYHCFPGIEKIDFKNVSLYDYMDSKGRMPVSFEQKFQIIEVSKKEGKYLELEPGQVIFYFEMLGMDATDTLVEYTESFTRTDKAEFLFTING